MSLDNGKVMLPWELVEKIHAQTLSVTTGRLLVAMLHQLDLQGLCGPQHAAAPEESELWAPLGVLRGRVGPKNPNSAAVFHRAREELLAAGLVTRCELVRHRRSLQWQFASEVIELMSRRQRLPYVLLDLEEIGACRSAFALRLYMIVRRVYGRKAPIFEVALFEEGIWDDTRRTLFRNLAHLAGLLDIVFRVALVYRRDRPEPDRVVCKISHRRTSWYPGALEKFPPHSRVWRIDRAGHRPLKP